MAKYQLRLFMNCNECLCWERLFKGRHLSHRLAKLTTDISINELRVEINKIRTMVDMCEHGHKLAMKESVEKNQKRTPKDQERIKYALLELDIDLSEL